MVRRLTSAAGRGTAPEGTHPDIGAFELDQSVAVPPPVVMTFTVTTTQDVVADDGKLSLREALALADVGEDMIADRIEFASEMQGQTIRLNGSQLECTPAGGQGQAADLTVCRACSCSNLTGLRYPSAEWSRLLL